MTIFNIHAAKTQLSKLIDAATGGQEVIIARAGKLVARLVPVTERPKRRLGMLDGKTKVPDNFETMFSEEITDMFERGR